MKTQVIRLLLTIVTILTSLTLRAVESDNQVKSINLSMDARVDYDLEDTESIGTHSGFHGRYLNMRLDGNINSQLSYSWRQRFNKFADLGNDVFSATDWVYICYRPIESFSIEGGKQIVLIGGDEYNYAPIDVFFCSRYWANIACYQFGASATYYSPDQNHSLSFQICNSPYQGMNSSCYAYNLFWAGNMGWLKTQWSVNLIEYQKGSYMNMIALGNHATFGLLDLHFDIMNRATSHHKYWFGDYTVIGEAYINVSKKLCIMLKGGKDNIYPVPGSPDHIDKPFYGGGIEFFPMKGSPDLRLHAIGDVYYDNNGMRNTELNLGITWRVNLYHTK